MSKEDTSRDERLEELKLEFIQAWEMGEGPDVDTFARQHPEFAEELIRFGVRFALVFTGPEPDPDVCDDYDAASAMRSVLQEQPARYTGESSETTKKEPQGPAPHFSRYLRSQGLMLDDFAAGIGVPNGLAYLVVQGVDSPSEKLIGRTASFLGLDFPTASAMVSREAGPPSAYLLRSESGAQPESVRLTWAQALEAALKAGELTTEQANDWSEDFQI